MEIKEIAELYNQNQELKSFVEIIYDWYKKMDYEPYIDYNKLGSKIHEYLVCNHYIDISYINYGELARWQPNSKFYNFIKEK